MFKKLFLVAEEGDEKQTERLVEKIESPTNFGSDAITFPKSTKVDVKNESVIKFPTVGETNFGESDYHQNLNQEKDNVVVNKYPQPNLNPHLEMTMKSYEKGFDGMNKDGTDFHEFYKSIIEGDNINNRQLYPTIFKIFTNVNPSFSVESALRDGQYYVDQLNEAHSELKQNGEKKRKDTILNKSDEQETLAQDISTLEGQLVEIKRQIDEKKIALGQIEGKYGSKLETIEFKLQANDIARNVLVDNIKTVMSNIQQTIKQ